MKKIIFLIGITFVNFLILQSCKKGEIFEQNKEEDNFRKSSTEKEFYVKEGILVFKNIDALVDYINNVTNLDEKELKYFENEIDFSSYKSFLQKVYERLGNANSESEYNSILNRDTNFFKKNKSYELVENIPDIFTYFINKDNFFRIGRTLSKVTDTEIIFYNLHNEEEFTNIINNNKNLSGLKTKKLKYSTYVSNLDITPNNKNNDIKNSMTSCGNYLEAEYWNHNTYRKIIGKIYIYKFQIWDYYHQTIRSFVTVSQQSKSYKKSWWRYRLYKTIHGRKNIKYTIWLHTPSGSHSFNYRDLQYREYYTNVWTRSQVYEILNSNYDFYTPNLYNVRGDFTSRGVGNHWARIDCN